MKRLSNNKRIILFIIIGVCSFIITSLVLDFCISSFSQQDINNNNATQDMSKSEKVGGLPVDRNNQYADNQDTEGTDKESHEFADNNFALSNKQDINNVNNDVGFSQEEGHIHSWIAHYNYRQIQSGTNYVIDQTAVYKSVTCCNVCGAKDVVYGVHQCNGGCFSSHIERIIISPEIGHWEPVYTQEQFIDYYYCCDCGCRQ